MSFLGVGVVPHGQRPGGMTEFRSFLRGTGEIMASTLNGYPGEAEWYAEQAFAETPFLDPRMHEQEEPAREAYVITSPAENWEFTTPFLPGESGEAGEGEAEAPEVAAFSEMTAELKDTLFREALEQLADEAIEAHGEQLQGEYGDRETRDRSAERVLNEHFAPLAAQAEAMLDRFFERLEPYEAESLTDTEIERISNEVLPTETPLSPASEQFLGGLLRKATKLVSGAVNLAKKGVQGAVSLAGKGLSAVANLALGPLLKPLKMLGSFLLKHVAKYALDQLPPAVRPFAKQLSDRLFQAIGHETEGEAYEQTESEVVAATPDAARLEAEFDVQVAQLLMTPDEAETEYLVTSYGEGESYSSPMPALDDTRTQLIKELSTLQPGESAGPVMEQFLPALWPAAKAAITILGRPKLVSFIGNLVNGLIKPLIGAEPAKLLAPSIADAGLRIFGLEANPDPRVVASEALAATVEETVNSVAEFPPHVLENETLLSDAVQEAFENAASAYFPNSVIRPAVRESVEQHGKWNRMPAQSRQKRYAKYSDSIPVEISPRVASGVDTFGSSTLHDHLRDHHGLQDGRSFKGKVTLYQALPGTRGSTIARAEGFPASQLHPLTPQAAGALLGPNAALGRHTPRPYLTGPQKLHVNQRLYRLEPPAGHHHHHHHPRSIHSEILINLLRGEIRLWLYLSEPLAQRIVADLAKPNNTVAAFKRIKPLLRKITDALKTAGAHHHLSHHILVVSQKPNLHGKVPHWLKHAGHHLGVKIGEWAQVQLAQYLRNSVEDFKRATASHHDGVTLRITMTNVPGMDLLQQLSQGKAPKDLSPAEWPKGSPAFQVIAKPGYAIHRLRT
jgi:hypothetical protein